ncbi:type IV toxin-antitoxin system AbiEi family antitoxin domain-containing protein [Stenotrophomonas maltophilia]
MERSSHAQRALALLHKQGYLRTRDLDTIGVPQVVLTRLSTSRQSERVGSGLYRLPGKPISEKEDFASIAVKVPRAVFCLLTALQFHELTTQLPRQVWIAMPRGSHTPRIEHPPIKMVQMAGDAYALGIDEHERDGARLRIYSPAKTVADCFKHRNQIGLDVAIEALKAAWKTRKASADDLWRHAKLCRVANVMRPYLEAVSHE